jgi:hypothetical protein
MVSDVTLKKLKILRDSIFEERLDEFNLRWFTKKRIQHIKKLIKDFEELKELGFDKKRVQLILDTLNEIKESYEIKGVLGFIKRRKKRKIILHYPLDTVEMLDRALNIIIKQLDHYIRSGEVISESERLHRVQKLKDKGFSLRKVQMSVKKCLLIG